MSTTVADRVRSAGWGGFRAGAGVIDCSVPEGAEAGATDAAPARVIVPVALVIVPVVRVIVGWFR
ncbi:hypothetical protein ACLQ22_02195 [Micromonospora sp. DT178]|uniref:hypothetical protein n=1 Tax=Micromonospora sp. DT178 TaxID=3393436 RepID=UPI003CEC60F6